MYSRIYWFHTILCIKRHSNAFIVIKFTANNDCVCRSSIFTILGKCQILFSIVVCVKINATTMTVGSRSTEKWNKGFNWPPVNDFIRKCSHSWLTMPTCVRKSVSSFKISFKHRFRVLNNGELSQNCWLNDRIVSENELSHGFRVKINLQYLSSSLDHNFRSSNRTFQTSF